jgi:hypothetical protein
LKAPRSKAGSCLLCPGSSRTGPARQGRADALACLERCVRVAWQCLPRRQSLGARMPWRLQGLPQLDAKARRGPSSTGRRFNSQVQSARAAVFRDQQDEGRGCSKFLESAQSPDKQLSSRVDEEVRQSRSGNLCVKQPASSIEGTPCTALVLR